MPQKYWDGIERRQKSQDHDTLIELVQILKSHADNFEKHVGHYDVHVEDDNKRFSFLNKSVWFGMGGIAVFQFIIMLKH